MFLNYEEQAIIRMYKFDTKEELKEKLCKALKEIEDTDMNKIVSDLINKLDTISLEELKNIDNIYE